MANDAYSQQALAQDPRFRQRVKGLIAQIAWQVLTEDPATVGHVQRANFARNTLANLDGGVNTIVGWLVMRTNLLAATTSVGLDLGIPVVATDATDAAILSQLATDWTNIAGA